jgi:hypothetical protein
MGSSPISLTCLTLDFTRAYGCLGNLCRRLVSGNSTQNSTFLAPTVGFPYCIGRCVGVAADVVSLGGFDAFMPHEGHKAAGMIRAAHRFPKDRRRSWAEADLTQEKCVLSISPFLL